MTHFVLVHGSGQNARCWSRLTDLLTARGHTVAAPDLPKHAPGWGIEDYAVEITRGMAGPDSVVIGHSLSGIFLPLLPQLRECGMLVFMAAVVPEPGKSIRDQFAADPTMFSAEWIDAGPRWFDESQLQDLAHEFLFHDCDTETLSWALDTMELIDAPGLAAEPSPLTAWPEVRTASIVASGDRTLSPDWGKRISRRVLNTEAIAVDAGHCPHMSRPGEIAAILHRLATRQTP